MNNDSRYTEYDAQRLLPEVHSGARTDFARDRARVLHSSAWRRLAAKTQVLSPQAGLDFARNRLTHSLEVAQIGRELAGSLGLSPDVVDTACLAHDLGHPPFGHNGEQALNEWAAEIGGFEGNAQTLRVLTRLEAKVFDDDGRSVGLNLTRASLDASCKYPWPRKDGMRKFGVYDDDLPVFAWLREGAPGERTCLEEQVMDWSDDVAYSVHDVEDAVHSGLVSLDAFTSRDVQRTVIDVARARFCPDRDPNALLEAFERLTGLATWPHRFDGSMAALAGLKAFTSALIGRFCLSAQVATQVAYGDGPLSRYDASLQVPEEVRDEVAVMKAIAVHFVMRREGAEAEYARQREAIAEVVHALVLDQGRSLEPWLKPAYAAAQSDADRLRVVIDQVASLTDTSIMHWHARLVG